MHEKVDTWVVFIWPAISFVLNAFWAQKPEEWWQEKADAHGFLGLCLLTFKAICQKYGADCGPDMGALKAKLAKNAGSAAENTTHAS